MGRMSRDKGKAGERELLNLLGEWLGMRLKRNTLQSDGGGSDAVDLPVSLEVKRSERFFASYLDQAAKQAAAEGKPAYLAWRKNRGEWVCLRIMSVAELADEIRERMT